METNFDMNELTGSEKEEEVDEEIVIEEKLKEKEPKPVNEEELGEGVNQNEKEEMNNDEDRDNVEDNEKEKDNNEESNVEENKEEEINKEQVEMEKEVEPIMDNMFFIQVQVPSEEEHNKVDKAQPEQDLQQNEDEESTKFPTLFKSKEAWE